MTDVHPALARVEDSLREHGVSGEVRWLPDVVTTAAAAATALGTQPGAIANSLVFMLDDAPLMVMTSGAHRVDTMWLGSQLGGTIGRASKDVVKEATGQIIGGVAPVGHPAPLRTLVDVALADFTRIWAAARHARTVFPTTYDELLRITAGTSCAVVPPA